MIPRFRQHGKDRLGRRCHGLGASSDWNTRCDWPQMLGIMAGIEGQFSTRSLLRSLSALAVACARLVYRLCSSRCVLFPLSSSPRCSTPWPIWTRGTVTPRSSSLRQWYVHGWFSWLRCFRAVFSLIVVWSRQCRCSHHSCHRFFTVDSLAGCPRQSVLLVAILLVSAHVACPRAVTCVIPVNLSHIKKPRPPATHGHCPRSSAFLPRLVPLLRRLGSEHRHPSKTAVSDQRPRSPLPSSLLDLKLHNFPVRSLCSEYNDSRDPDVVAAETQVRHNIRHTHTHWTP